MHDADRDGGPTGDVRALVLTGADGMFSSGYDIGDLGDDVFAEEAERLVAHPFASALEALDATDLPTVAALPGHTIGGGLELALGCDLRVAADGIRLSMPPAKLGLVDRTRGSSASSTPSARRARASSSSSAVRSTRARP